MQGLTGIVLSLKEKLPGAIANIVKKLPEIGQKVKKFLTPVYKAVKSGIQWIIDHKKGIIGVISGVGMAFVTYKIGRKIADIVTGLKSLQATLGPVGIAISAIELAIGAVTAAIVTYEQYERELINNNLEEHFGNISLSISEVQSVAQALLDSNVLHGINEALDEFSKLDSIQSAIDNARDTIDKTNWKVSIGLSLSEEEKSDYKSAVRDFVKETSEYLEQEHYAVMINLSTTFDTDTVEGNAIVNKVDAFFRSQEGTMASLGQRLVGVVNQAFQDGFIDDLELDKIVDLEKKIAELQEKIMLGKQQAKMASLSLEFSGVNLDPDSATALQEELAAQSKSIAESAYESFSANMEAFSVAGLVGDELKTAQEEAWKTYMDTATQAQTTTLDFLNQTVWSAYGEDMGEDYKTVKDMLKSQMENLTADQAEHWEESWETISRTTRANIQNYHPDETQRKAVLEYLGLAEPTDKEIQDLIEKYKSAGQKVPEEVVNSIMQFSAMEMMHDGDYVLPKSIVELFMTDMIEDSETANYDQIGNTFVTGTANAIKSNAGIAETAATEVINGVKQRVQTEAATPFIVDANVALNVHVIGIDASEVTNALSGIKTGAEYVAPGSGGKYALADGGFTQGVSIAGEEGQEAVISFKSSVRDRNINIWKKAGKILGATKSSGTSAETSETVTASNGSNITFAPNITFTPALRTAL